MAHMTETIYQRAHQVFADHFPGDWVLSLHGMARAGISISDGTGQELSDEAAAVKLGRALMTTFPMEHVTSCNAWDGAVEEKHLCGGTNTQGRYINYSTMPCTESSSMPSGRFIHLEQGSAIRAQGELVSQSITEALESNPGL